MPLLVSIAILSVLVLFIQQNWSPSLTLVFLGNTSRSAPMALWMLGAVLLGAVTTLVMSVLLRAASYQLAQQYDDTDEPAPPPRPRAQPYTSDEEESWAEEDWLEDLDAQSDAQDVSRRREYGQTQDRPQDVSRHQVRDRPPVTPQDEERDTSDPSDATLRSSKESPKTFRDYERIQQPQRATQDGSAYSYSYRESGRSEAGRKDAVYDAEFRVLIPPYVPDNTSAPLDDLGTQNEPEFSIPEPEEEEEVWDGAEEDDWGSRSRNNSWADDDR